MSDPQEAVLARTMRKLEATIENWEWLVRAGNFNTAYLHPERAEGETR
jgi:hypothetical protein